MSEILIVLSVLAAIVILTIFDKKFNLGLNADYDLSFLKKTSSDSGYDELNSKDFSGCSCVSESGKSTKLLQDLKQRIEVLERIVTSSDYELKEKIKALK